MINLFQPDVGEAELSAVAQVFSTKWLGMGERTRRFEVAFADHLGVPPVEVVSVSSCTEGLFQAVAALDLGPGDEVVLPSISFIGAAHAIRSSGAQVVLCDVDPRTMNPRIDDIERALSPDTRAVVILHYGGAPGSVEAIASIAKARSVLLIEDAACAIGANSSGRPCGTFGDVGIWSFDSMKTITTGDGGMMWARNPSVADRLRAGIQLGGDSSGFARRADSARWWEVDPPAVGRRAMMNDVAAAMGLVQLGRLPAFLRRRRKIVIRYDQELADLPWLQIPPPADRETAPTFYWIQAEADVRDRLAVHLLRCEVYSSFRYWPLHRTQIYGTSQPYPGASHAADRTLLLPLHQGLSDADIDIVTDAIRSFLP